MKINPAVTATKLALLAPGTLVEISSRTNDDGIFALIAGRRAPTPGEGDTLYLIFLDEFERMAKPGQFVRLDGGWDETVLSFGSAFEFAFDSERKSDVDFGGRHNDLTGAIVPSSNTAFIRVRSADHGRLWTALYDINTGYFADHGVQAGPIAIMRWHVRLPNADRLQAPIELLTIDVTPRTA
jgi:hypothetical protein